MVKCVCTVGLSYKQFTAYVVSLVVIYNIENITNNYNNLYVNRENIHPRSYIEYEVLNNVHFLCKYMTTIFAHTFLQLSYSISIFSIKKS